MKRRLLFSLVFALSASYGAEKSDIYIWDGNADLILHISVTDAVTHAAIPRTTLWLARDRRVKHGPDGRNYINPAVTQTDRLGRATLKAGFPAAGSADGFSVFVYDSYVSADAPSYRRSRVRISPIHRLDFPPKKEHCDVSIAVALHRQ